MLAIQSRVEADDVDQAVDKILKKHHGRYSRLTIKAVLDSWYEYTITMEVEDDEV